MFTVYFSKKFLSGNLEGLTYDGTISFPTRQSAQEWIDGVMGHTIKAQSGTHVFLSAEIR